MLDAHAEASAEKAYDESCQKGRDDGALPETCNLPQADVAEQCCKNYQRDVVDDLEVAEGQFEAIGEGKNESFTGNDHGVAGDFQHDAEGHDGTADKRHAYAQRPGFRDERMSYPHAEVDEYTENKHAGKLKELPWWKVLPSRGI